MALDDDTTAPQRESENANPPALNVPGVVLVSLAVLAAFHILRTEILGPVADTRMIVQLAFIPGCYSEACGLVLDRSAGADIWSPLSHALLHGDWAHLGLNMVWLLAFGSPVAKRLGTSGFLFFSGVGAAAGAAAFYLLNPTLVEPVIGASGVVSALMGGACRFAFSTIGRRGIGAAEAPRLSIGAALSDRTILFFIVIFFATNLLTGSALGMLISGGAQIAWEAHIGGFAFGFFGFGLFDTASRASGEGRRGPSAD